MSRGVQRFLHTIQSTYRRACNGGRNADIEVLKPLSISHDELAEAMGACKQNTEDIICGLRRLTDDEARVLTATFCTDEDFWIKL